MKIKYGFKGKDLLKKGFTINFKKKDTKELAMNIASMVQARVPTGKDINDKPFGDYSPKYRKFKDERGGRGKGSTVNLTWGGSMLNSLGIIEDRSTYGATNSKLKFFVGPSLARHKAPYSNKDRISNNAIGYFIHTGKLGRKGRSGPIIQRPPRHWLGLTDKDQKNLGDIFKLIFKRAMGRK